ncbi:MAG: hypothetical protein AAF961_06245 [Planctomycetota bacterium]
MPEATLTEDTGHANATIVGGGTSLSCPGHAEKVAMAYSGTAV